MRPRVALTACKHPTPGLQTSPVVGSHSVTLSERAGSHYVPTGSHCLQLAHKQTSETTLFADSQRSLLLNGLRLLDLVNARVHSQGDPMEPACPESPSVGNCPKKDGSSPSTETPGGLVMQ